MSTLAEIEELLQTAESILAVDPSNAEALELKASVLAMREALTSSSASASPAAPTAEAPADTAAAPVTEPSWPPVGARVVALWPEDGQRYIARVDDLPSPGRVTVTYLQYGNSDTVDLAEVSPFVPAKSLEIGTVVAALWPEDGMFYEASVIGPAPAAEEGAAPAPVSDGYLVRFSHTGTEEARQLADIYVATPPALTGATVTEHTTETNPATLTVSDAPPKASPTFATAAAPVPSAPVISAAAAFAAASANHSDDDEEAAATEAAEVDAASGGTGRANSRPEPYWPRDMPPIDPQRPSASVWVIPPRLLVTPADTETEKRLKLLKTKRLKEMFWKRVHEIDAAKRASEWQAVRVAGGIRPSAPAPTHGMPPVSGSPAAPLSAAGAQEGAPPVPAPAAGLRVPLAAAMALKKRSIFSGAGGPGASKLPRGPGAGAGAGRGAGGRGNVSGGWE